MVAAVAAEDPDTAAKMPQPSTLTCTSRPGRRRTQGARPLNMSSARRVRYRISPIQMNSGRAVSAQLAPESQALVAKMIPASASANTTMASTLQAIRASPGKLKASGTAQGGIWHVSLWGLLDEQGIPPASVPWVPSAGAAAGFLDLVAGGVDIVPASHGEARSLIDAGKVRSLAILDDQPSALYPDVPTGKQAIGTSWKMNVWRGFAAPRGLPADIQAGDWIEIGMLGAYGAAMKTRFNGFGTAEAVIVADEPMASLYTGERELPQSDNVVSLR